MDKYIKCYVLYCTDDKTFLSPMGFWNEDVLQAVRYKDLNRVKEAKTHYDNSIKIMEVSMGINGTILSQE